MKRMKNEIKIQKMWMLFKDKGFETGLSINENIVIVKPAKIVLKPTKPVNMTEDIHTINADSIELGYIEMIAPRAVPAPFPPLKLWNIG